jgi:hypothetical protein
MKDERDQIEDIKKQKAALEARLAKAQLKNLALESLIECVEEHYHIDVKKFWRQGVEKVLSRVKELKSRFSRGSKVLSGRAVLARPGGSKLVFPADGAQHRSVRWTGEYGSCFGAL